MYLCQLIRPPRMSNRFPYTPLFRSVNACTLSAAVRSMRSDAHRHRAAPSCLRDSRSEEHTSELQSRQYLVCRLMLEIKKIKAGTHASTRLNAARIDTAAPEIEAGGG